MGTAASTVVAAIGPSVGVAMAMAGADMATAAAEGSLDAEGSRDAVPQAASVAARLGAGRLAAASAVTRPFAVVVASVAEAASTVAAVSTAEAAPEVADAGKLHRN